MGVRLDTYGLETLGSDCGPVPGKLGRSLVFEAINRELTLPPAIGDALLQASDPRNRAGQSLRYLLYPTPGRDTPGRIPGSPQVSPDGPARPLPTPKTRRQQDR